jgi:hypothetical protein
MKKTFKYLVAAVGLVTFLGSCAHTPCNNDACYNRELSSVDPYENGQVAAWGSEEWERKKEQRVPRGEYK